MTKNEEKAIEILKNTRQAWCRILSRYIDKQQKEIEEKNVAINKMSKDISRQLKEIEKLNFENHMLKKWNEQLDRNCISKDKIRERKKWYEDTCEHLSKNGIDLDKYDQYQGAIELCEELLEEN